jgi:hypothetical protein
MLLGSKLRAMLLGSKLRALFLSPIVTPNFLEYRHRKKDHLLYTV